jgi:hypothetical protein
MTFINDYNQAVKVLKENNPHLAEAIDLVLRETSPSHASLFSNEPDIRIFGEHKSTRKPVQLFWRQLFFSPNEIQVIAWINRDDPKYTGTVIDSNLRMTLGYLTEGRNVDLLDETPMNTLFGILKKTDPPYSRDEELQPTLDGLAKAAGVKAFYHYTSTRPGANPFRYSVRRIF